jgi:hypothetical protein
MILGDHGQDNKPHSTILRHPDRDDGGRRHHYGGHHHDPRRHALRSERADRKESDQLGAAGRGQP